MEAVLPQAMAEYKMVGFIQDVCGKLIESIPGLIRLRLGAAGSSYEVKKGLLGLFSRKTGEIEVYLRIQQEGRSNRQKLTIFMRSLDGDDHDSPKFRERCDRIHGDLRSYLMGGNNS